MKITNLQIKKILQNLEKNLKPNHFKFAPKSLQTSEIYINKTINIFSKHHSFDKRFFTSIKPMFKKFIEHDRLVYIEDEIVLKELYKLLFNIKQTDDLLSFINSKNYYNKFFIENNTKSKRIRSMNINKQQVINKECYDLGEQRLNWYFKFMYLKNKNLTTFYSYIFSLINIEDIKMDNVDRNKINKVNFQINKLLVFNTNEDDILKSLSIYLYFQFKNYFEMKTNYTKTVIQEIMFNLFNYTPNFEEFDKTIYVKSLIKDSPIFAAKKNNHFNNKEKQFLIKNLSKHFMFLDKKTTSILIEHFLKNPHITYLNKYPVELFSKN